MAKVYLVLEYQAGFMCSDLIGAVFSTEEAAWQALLGNTSITVDEIDELRELRGELLSYYGVPEDDEDEYEDVHVAKVLEDSDPEPDPGDAEAWEAWTTRMTEKARKVNLLPDGQVFEMEVDGKFELLIGQGSFM